MRTKTIMILGRDIEIREHRGQRVITFADIDFVHGRPEGTARKRFNDNRKHFIEGIDYYKIQPSEIRTVGIISPNGGYVLTESGYLLLVKSFTDDIAWQVQRQLVNAYFRRKGDKRRVAEQPKLEEPYEYVEKRWNGQVVASVRDIREIWKDVSLWSIKNAIKHYLVPKIDFFELKGVELARFKRENLLSGNARLANTLNVITYSGLKKLAKVIANGDFKPFEKLGIESKLNVPAIKTGTIEVLNIPGDEKAQTLIKSTEAKLTAMSEMLTLINKYNSMDDFNAHIKSLMDLCSYLYTSCMDLRDLKPRIVQKAW